MYLYLIYIFLNICLSSSCFYAAAATAAKSLQSCPTLCDPIDGSPPGFSNHGIFQARVLEWGAIAFSDVSILQPKPKRIQELLTYFLIRSTWSYRRFHLVLGHLVGGKHLWSKTCKYFFSVNILESVILKIISFQPH